MYKRFIVLSALLVLISGCFTSGSSKKPVNTQPSSGIFKTLNKGETWVQKGDLYTVTAPAKRLTYTDVKFIKTDPLDTNTLYIGTDSALYYSYNRGEGWFETLRGKGVVNDIAVDPADKCTIYAAVNISIYKTTDCARSWNVIHFSSLKGQFFTSVLVSKSDSNLVFIGASNGVMLYSKNAGMSWEVFRTFENTILTQMMSHPKEPNSFYVITPRYGIQRTDDLGVSWVSLHDLSVRSADGSEVLNSKGAPTKLRELKNSLTYFDLQFDLSQEEDLIYASGYGIFRLIDGEYWQEIDILSKPRQETIYSIALDSTGTNLYFVTKGAFYRSDNAGKDWSVRKLPATGQPRFLTIASDVPGELYISFYAPPQK